MRFSCAYNIRLCEIKRNYKCPVSSSMGHGIMDPYYCITLLFCGLLVCTYVGCKNASFAYLALKPSKSFFFCKFFLFFQFFSLLIYLYVYLFINLSVIAYYLYSFCCRLFLSWVLFQVFKSLILFFRDFNFIFDIFPIFQTLFESFVL